MEAFQAGLITDEQGWLSLLEARNLTSHMYDETMAAKIYALIVQQHPILGDLVTFDKNSAVMLTLPV